MAETDAPAIKPWCKDDKDKLQRLINDGRVDITRTNDTQYIDRVHHSHFRECDPVNFRRNFQTYARSFKIKEHYAGFRACLAAGGTVFCYSYVIFLLSNEAFVLSAL